MLTDFVPYAMLDHIVFIRAGAILILSCAIVKAVVDLRELLDGQPAFNPAVFVEVMHCESALFSVHVHRSTVLKPEYFDWISPRLDLQTYSLQCLYG